MNFKSKYGSQNISMSIKSSYGGNVFNKTAQQMADDYIKTGNELESIDINQAIEQYHKALECVPDYWRAWLNLAIAYELMNDAKNRLLMLKKAYNSNPESHLTCYNLALAYQQLGMGDADIKILLKKSLQINPDFTNAMIVLAEFYYNNDDSQSALNYINKFLEKQPNHIGALYNKASYLEGLGQEQEALTLLTQLSEIDIAAKAKLALFLRKRGYANKAKNVLLSVIKDEPNLNYISSYLMTLLFVQSTQKEYEYAYELLNNYKTNDDWSKRPANMKKRIGFLSPDLNAHAVAYFIEPVLKELDRQKYEVFIYDISEKQDFISRRLQSMTENWHQLYNQSTEVIVNQIRFDNIDLLFDLAGHSSNNRLDVLMHKPAPIMATWLGYLASTGLSVMDFRLVDAITDPIGWAENQHIESLIRMEGAQWCYQIQEGTPTIQMPTPFEKNGFITFGSFNQCDKLSEECLSGWADILKVVTNSQLMFMAVGDGMAKQRIIHIMQNQGIDASRLKFEPRKNWQAYFESYNAVDIALDSYPYSGATTACDSLVMGVPVLTLVGERSISRSVASILTQVNYEYWIAHNKAELSHIAKKCAEDIAEGAYPKADIRQKFTQSNLTHAKDFAQRFSAAIDVMLSAKH